VLNNNQVAAEHVRMVIQTKEVIAKENVETNEKTVTDDADKINHKEKHLINHRLTRSIQLINTADFDVVETLASLALDNHGHGADSAIATLLMSMVSCTKARMENKMKKGGQKGAEYKPDYFARITAVIGLVLAITAIIVPATNLRRDTL
jgi:CHASE3 domain sensor protein